MPSFQYEAMNSEGKTVKDRISARDADDAIAKIRELSLFPTRVKAVAEKDRKKSASGGGGAATSAPAKKKGGGGGFIIGGVRSQELTNMTRQLSTLIDAGIPVVRSLNILEEQMRPCALKNVLGTVSSDVEGGSSLSEAMATHPKAFDELFINMVKAGEAGGVLDVVLQRLSEFREKAARLKRRIVSAMIYPIAVITFAFMILTGIIVFIIPKFMDMFKELGVDLPLPTKMLLLLSDVFVYYWYMIPLVPIGAVVLYKVVRATRTGHHVFDWMKFHVPLFGSIMKKGAIARFTRTFGTLIASGVPILEALNISRDTAGNILLADAISTVHDSIREGEPIAAPLAQTKICDDMVVNMIDVGEETGNLDNMLMKIADNYDDQVDVAVDGLTSLMEPIMVIALGLIVGFIVVSLFLPLVTLMQSLS